MSNLARISSIMSWTETFLGGGPAPFLPLPGLSFTGPAAGRDALILDGGLDDFRLANLLHQVGHAALLDELRADVFGERGELLDLGRVGEEAGQEMEALHEPGEQIDERLALFQVRNLRLKAGAQRVDEELHLRVCAGGNQFHEIGGILLREYARRQNLGVEPWA